VFVSATSRKQWPGQASAEVPHEPPILEISSCDFTPMLYDASTQPRLEATDVRRTTVMPCLDMGISVDLARVSCRR